MNIEQLSRQRAIEIYAERFFEEDTPAGYFIKPLNENSTGDEIKEAIKQSMVEGYSVSRWVSVDTPPEFDKVVIGWWNEKTIESVVRSEIEGDIVWWYSQDGEPCINPPLYYMLPSPPSKDNV